MSTPTPALDPKRTALLVMDFQQGVLQRMPGLEPLLGRVQRAIADVRDHGGTIGYVRVAFTEQDWAAVPAANPIFAQAAQNRMMHHEDPATAIHDSLAPQPGDIVVRKTRVGAMSTTDLDRQLRDRGIDTLVLAGISTSGVVLSTVIEAADRDYSSTSFPTAPRTATSRPAMSCWARSFRGGRRSSTPPRCVPCSREPERAASR
jgi:nicotinamidase-related amidase